MKMKIVVKYFIKARNVMQRKRDLSEIKVVSKLIQSELHSSFMRFLYRQGFIISRYSVVILIGQSATAVNCWEPPSLFVG